MWILKHKFSRKISIKSPVQFEHVHGVAVVLCSTLTHCFLCGGWFPRFANNSNLRRALEDFEQALTLNPNHPNARKYMSETLVALGR